MSYTRRLDISIPEIKAKIFPFLEGRKLGVGMRDVA